MKACKDCQHLRQTPLLEDSWEMVHVCVSPQLPWRTNDWLNGEKRISPHPIAACRDNSELCGNGGKWFEPKRGD